MLADGICPKASLRGPTSPRAALEAGLEPAVRHRSDQSPSAAPNDEHGGHQPGIGPFHKPPTDVHQTGDDLWPGILGGASLARYFNVTFIAVFIVSPSLGVWERSSQQARGKQGGARFVSMPFVISYRH